MSWEEKYAAAHFSCWDWEQLQGIRVESSPYAVYRALRTDLLRGTPLKLERSALSCTYLDSDAASPCPFYLQQSEEASETKMRCDGRSKREAQVGPLAVSRNKNNGAQRRGTRSFPDTPTPTPHEQCMAWGGCRRKRMNGTVPSG